MDIEKRIAKVLTPMLKAHEDDGDIGLFNPDLTWKALGKWYAKAIAEELRSKGD